MVCSNQELTRRYQITELLIPSNEERPIGAPEFRSVSQYEGFLKCGEAYRLSKVMHAPKRPAAWLYQGTAFHEASDQYERGWVDAIGAERVFEEQYDLAIAKAMEKQPNLKVWNTGGRKLTVDDINDRRERGKDQLRRYIAWLPTRTERNLELFPGEPANEYGFELDLDGVKVKGFIDRILLTPEGKIQPRDLKTGTKQPESELQLAVYGIAIEDLTGIRPMKGDYYMAKDNKLPEWDLSKWTRERVTAYFHRVDRNIREGMYVPNPGSHCRICDVEEWCPIRGNRTDYVEKF